MINQPPRTRTITHIGSVPLYFRLAHEIGRLILAADQRAIRRAGAMTPYDTMFNVIRSVLLANRLTRFRRAVKFGDQIVLDSTVPPFPSPAFTKRMANYLNNLEMTRLPSGIVSISTTNMCPYACAFCSTNAKRDESSDLDEELLKRTISQVEAIGVPLIILHGGEPFYRYDRYLRLVKHVSPDTCLWMFTTGYGVTPERAAELKENGLFGAWVSLDHYDARVHNRLRGNREAFDNACRAVEHFKKAGVYTCLSLVPPPDLCQTEEFLKYYDFAKELGVAEIRVMEMKPSGREACRGVTPHSRVLEKLHKHIFFNPNYMDHPPLSGLSTWVEKDQALGCQCRFEYLFITSRGEVQPCEASEISFGNIREEDFLSVYKRACEAFPSPSTGCIPMVMYPEVRDYVKISDQLSSPEKAGVATRIMEGFRAKGRLPWAYKYIWSTYDKRLSALKRRRQSASGGA